MKELFIARNPQKNYGILNYGGECPTLLATDYKSPPWVIEVEYEEVFNSGESRKMERQ